MNSSIALCWPSIMPHRCSSRLNSPLTFYIHAYNAPGTHSAWRPQRPGNEASDQEHAKAPTLNKAAAYSDRRKPRNVTVELQKIARNYVSPAANCQKKTYVVCVPAHPGLRSSFTSRNSLPARPFPHRHAGPASWQTWRWRARETGAAAGLCGRRLIQSAHGSCRVKLP